MPTDGERWCADRHEPGVTEGELSRVAVYEVEGNGEDDVDPDPDHHIEVIGIYPVGKMRDTEGHQHGGEQGEVRLGHDANVGFDHG